MAGPARSKVHGVSGTQSAPTRRLPPPVYSFPFATTDWPNSKTRALVPFEPTPQFDLWSEKKISDDASELLVSGDFGGVNRQNAFAQPAAEFGALRGSQWELLADPSFDFLDGLPAIGQLR